MGKCVIKLDGKYMQWTSVSDSPCCPLLPEPLFKRYWDAKYGFNGGFDYLIAMRDLERGGGCSARGYTVNSVISNNRAGAGGKRMTKAQIIKEFTITDEKEFEGWLESQKAAILADNARWAEELKKGT
jgi:hypothetical protein